MKESQFGQKTVQITQMVFILAASSLDHALETLTPEKREQYKEKKFFNPAPESEKKHQKSEKNCSKFAFQRSEREK